MCLKRIIYIISTLLLFACTSYASIPLSDWRVSVTASSLYPVNVTQGYGINYEEGWTSPLHNFTQFMRISDIENIRKRLPEYDGFGLPVQRYSMIRSRQVSPTNRLPQAIYLSWVSLTNNAFYMTKYPLSESVITLMRTSRSYVREDGVIVDSCYRTEFVFGLKPNGNAVVFLKGCGELIHISELPPERIMDKDSHGFDADDYKKRSYLSRIQKRADELGVALDPIPWDKVNKVYSDYPITN